jgi:hypothetical protein
MISDVLYEADLEIRRYLDELPKVYDGPIKPKIERLLQDMESIRIELDTPPLHHLVLPKGSTKTSRPPSS